jgi:hypothetical protein
MNASSALVGIFTTSFISSGQDRLLVGQPLEYGLDLLRRAVGGSGSLFDREARKFPESGHDP